VSRAVVPYHEALRVLSPSHLGRTEGLFHIDATEGALRGRWAAWTGIVLGCVSIVVIIAAWTYVHQHL
jgi:hypothetical protein